MHTYTHTNTCARTHAPIHTHTHALPEGEIVRLAVTSSNWRMMTDLRTKTTTKHHAHTERAVLHRQTHSENSTIVQWIATHTKICIFAPQIDRLTHNFIIQTLSLHRPSQMLLH